MSDKLCIVCNNEIIARRSDAKFCQDKCGHSYRNKKWRLNNPDKVLNQRLKEFDRVPSSLDKIIPELGYIKGNVRVISSRANLLKSNAYVEEMELILKDLKEIGRYKNR